MPIDPKSIAPSSSSPNKLSVPGINQIITSVSYDVFLEPEGNNQVAAAIGFITNVRAAFSRTNTRQRHLSSADAGRIIEITPGLENITLNVSGFNLYNTSNTQRNDLPARLTGMAGLICLSQNSEYFAIKKTVKYPGVSTDIKNKTTGLLFRRCLLASFDDVVDINTLTQALNAVIDVSWVEASADSDV